MVYKAKWTAAAEAEYSMVYWLENMDNEEYSMIGTEIKTGVAGAAPVNKPEGIPFYPLDEQQEIPTGSVQSPVTGEKMPSL